MWATITKPFAWLMVKLYELTGNYGLAVILFALAVNLILTPFMAKSKKSMMRSTRLQPRIQELQKRHEGNPQKLNQEMQNLYREEGINPMSGCLWSLIPFPILIALYSVIRQPITRMMFAAQDVVTTLQDYFVANGLYTIPTKADAYVEIKLANLAHEHWDAVATDLAGKIDGLLDVDFGFLGLNLGSQPQWNFFVKTDWSDVSAWLPALGLFLIPFISAALSWLSMKVSNAANPQQDAQTQASMKTMNLMMPLMSIWICFVMPAAMGIYWIANSVFGMIRDFVLTKVYKRKLDKEDAERQAMRSAREKELEEKRLETERLRAEGKTEKNTNTSKKKIQANEKQKQDERKAALDKAERAARRERLGIKEEEKPASQVGNRRYARGRAYVADRFTNPENAEEATLAAAAASEGADPIDESVEETITTPVEETVITPADETAQSDEEN
ncbi:MAG: YidC/Oxa1 family membrane protein insertase [Candidatus Limivicinus sp.]|nr:YidC/Oxa1 family membrane protein insertase [Clostridiales bacterium]MDY6132548.1 YidC/Oxa1 family membrane protein insertase [Candidatus Limivicinus sp.]